MLIKLSFGGRQVTLAEAGNGGEPGLERESLISL
jgi:hypothetical protein